MTCIICGTAGSYTATIKGMGICLCETHLGSASFESALKIDLV